MDNYLINDIRDIKVFRGISFSEYKKSDVHKQLIKSIIANNIEESCYWGAELICAGHYMDLWEIVLLIIGKHIHLGNPKLCTYIELRYNGFRNIILSGYINNELALRNNMKIRELFGEILTILCISNKRPPFESIKIKKDEFDITYLTTKCKAPSITFCNNIFHKDDPKELIVSVNDGGTNLDTIIQA